MILDQKSEQSIYFNYSVSRDELNVDYRTETNRGNGTVGELWFQAMLETILKMMADLYGWEFTKLIPKDGSAGVKITKSVKSHTVTEEANHLGHLDSVVQAYVNQSQKYVYLN